MENPYRNVIGLVGVGPAVEREKHYAWEQGHDYAIFAEGRTITQDDYDAAYDKGHAEAKAEQAEIVSELVEVMETVRLQLGIWSNTPHNWEYYNLIDWMSASQKMLEAAIEKAREADDERKALSETRSSGK